MISWRPCKAQLFDDSQLLGADRAVGGKWGWPWPPPTPPTPLIQKKMLAPQKSERTLVPPKIGKNIVSNIFSKTHRFDAQKIKKKILGSAIVLLRIC